MAWLPFKKLWHMFDLGAKLDLRSKKNLIDFFKSDMLCNDRLCNPLLCNHKPGLVLTLVKRSSDDV